MQKTTIPSCDRPKSGMRSVRGMRPQVCQFVGLQAHPRSSSTPTGKRHVSYADVRPGTPSRVNQTLQAELPVVHEAITAAIRLLGKQQAERAVCRILRARRSQRAVSLAFDTFRNSIQTGG